MTSLMATSSTLLMRRMSTQTSVGHDDIDVVTSPEAATAQTQLMQCLACSIDVVARFSPDLAQVLLDQSFDISEFVPLLDASFTSPTPEQQQLSFGTLLSAASLCVKNVAKVSE